MVTAEEKLCVRNSCRQ